MNGGLKMTEYISREEAIKELREVYEQEYPTASGNFDEYASHDMPNVLRNIPAADVQPVKHGRWEAIGEQSAKCTACGGVLKSNGIDKTGKALIFNAVYHYCPYCGARMDLGDEKT